MKSIPVIIIYNNNNTPAAKTSKPDKHKEKEQILRTVEINLIYKSNNLILQFH